VVERVLVLSLVSFSTILCNLR